MQLLIESAELKVVEDLSETAKEKFVERVELAKALDHPHIVPVYSSGFDNDGKPFVVCEKPEGRTLSEIFATREKLATQTIATLFSQLCDALDYAFKNGITIGDITPESIVVTGIETGEPYVKLNQLGVQRNSFEDSSPLTLLAVPSAVRYASPERCVGKKTDERSLVYSVGCLLYEAVYRKSAFEGTDPIKVMFDHVSGDPLVVPHYGSKFELLIRRCMDRNIGERLRDLKTLKNQLEQIANTAPKQPLPPTESEAAARAAARAKMEKQLFQFCMLVIALAMTMHNLSTYSQKYNAFRRDVTNALMKEREFAFDNDQERLEKWKQLDRVAYQLYLPPSTHADILMRMQPLATNVQEQRKLLLSAANGYRLDYLPHEEMETLSAYQLTFAAPREAGRPFYYQAQAAERIPILLRESRLRKRYGESHSWSEYCDIQLVEAYMTQEKWDIARILAESVVRKSGKDADAYSLWRAAECNYRLGRLPQAQYFYTQALHSNYDYSPQEYEEIKSSLSLVKVLQGICPT